MYKHVALLVRKAGMSHEAFIEHWRKTHTPIAREIEGVVRYHQVMPVDAGAASFDGIAELYFEEVDALYDALGSEGSRDYDPDRRVAKQAREDVDNFLDIERRPRFIGEETVELDAVGGDTDGLYKQSLFFDHWSNEYAQLAQELPGVVRCAHVTPTDPDHAEFDGVVELYFEDLDALRSGVERAFSDDAVGSVEAGFIGQERLIKDDTE